MKVIIAKIVVVSFLVVCLVAVLDDPHNRALLVAWAIAFTLLWAIKTIADDRNQKKEVT